MNQSIVKGCTLFGGMALKAMALVGFCSGMSMADPTETVMCGPNAYYASIYANENLTGSSLVESTEHPSEKNNINITKGNLHLDRTLFAPGPDDIEHVYTFRVYNRTENGSI